MQFGLYHPLEQGAWRKVSEDSGESRPFLLIDCTVEIFTTARYLAMSTHRYSVFPAYSQVYLRNYNFRSCPNYLPTNSTSSARLWRLPIELTVEPIVTAAVYRGFDQELRLAADPIN